MVISFEIDEMFKNTFFEKHLQTTASDRWSGAWLPFFYTKQKIFFKYLFPQCIGDASFGFIEMPICIFFFSSAMVVSVIE